MLMLSRFSMLSMFGAADASYMPLVSMPHFHAAILRAMPHYMPLLRYAIIAAAIIAAERSPMLFDAFAIAYATSFDASMV